MTKIKREVVEKIFFETDEEIKRDFCLPIRWDGKDFYKELYLLLKDYQDRIKKVLREKSNEEYRKQIETICRWVCLAVSESIHGNPNKAYETVDKALTFLTQNHSCFVTEDDLNHAPLYRAVDVKDRAKHDRKRIFHVPFNMRSKMATTRYSIPGYPSLYLGTSLELNCLEIGKDPYRDNVMAARFEYRNEKLNDDDYYVDDDNMVIPQFQKPLFLLDLGIKPQDYQPTDTSSARRSILNKETNQQKGQHLMENPDHYLFWYPLIAACSFIRAFRNDPYSAEYIVPQLITQWAKKAELPKKQKKTDNTPNDEKPLFGVRYFSCVSERASEMGLNYAFPSSGNDIWLFEDIKNFCPILATNFVLTEPVFISEYESIGKCQNELGANRNLQQIGEIKKVELDKIEYVIPDGEDFIPDCTFCNCKKIKDIIIPDSVTSIGDSAFLGCSSIESIIIPNGVTSIGDYAFYGCESLKNIFLSNSLTSIGVSAFSECFSLKKVTIPDSVSTIESWAFTNCANITRIAIPSNVTRIGTAAFSDCRNLSKISVSKSNSQYYCQDNCVIERETKKLILGCANSIIPKDGNVAIIDEHAFHGCCELSDINLPSSITHIGNWAFYGCICLQEITIPKNVISIGDRSFSMCLSLVSITVSEGNKKYHSQDNCIIDNDTKQLIAGCKNSIIPPNGNVTSIGPYAFLYCHELKSINIPDSVTSIGDNAFYGCSGLTEVTIPDSISSIGNLAFAACDNLHLILPRKFKGKAKLGIYDPKKITYY